MTEQDFQRTVWVSSADGRNSDMSVKIVTVGTAGVGKSSLLARFVAGTFTSNPPTTICVDYFDINLIIRNKKVRCIFWDTAGQDHLVTIVKTYLRDANLMLFVFDLSDEQTFIQMKERIERERMVCEDAVCALIGTKFDLFDRLPSTSREKQLFSQDSLDKCAADLGFTGGAYQVSSLSKYNVEKTLLKLLNTTVEFMETNKNNAEKESLNLNHQAKKTSSCCKT
jgi:small GTP-binding protein